MHFLSIISLWRFAQSIAAQLSCRVENTMVITLLEFRWEQNEISIEFEFRVFSETACLFGTKPFPAPMLI